MLRTRSLRLVGAVAVLAAWSAAARAAVVYSDTVLARGAEYASTTALTLAGPGNYQITATDLQWLDAPLSALSFGAFTATAPIKTMLGAGTLEFFYAGQGKVFLQLYARTAAGKSAGLVGIHVKDMSVVPLPASVWLLLSALASAALWRRLQRAAALARFALGRAPAWVGHSPRPAAAAVP